MIETPMLFLHGGQYQSLNRLKQCEWQGLLITV